MSRPRVTLFVHDLAGNPVVRAAPLAEALSAEFEVEMVGLLLSGTDVYAPFRGRFPTRALPCRPALASVLAAVPRLARTATGDLLYACKPLPGTLLPARMAARRLGVPFLLDVEDDEWAARRVDAPAAGLRGVAQRLADTGRHEARLLHPLTRGAAAVTVSSRALQARYGGVLVRHGPDESRWDPRLPALADRAALRAALGLPADRRLAVFAGVPRPHKGWDTLLRALRHPAAAAWDLVVAGAARPGFTHGQRVLGDRFHVLGPLPNHAMPRLLAAADAAPVPQRDTPYARAQLPAKALEAMAMGVPVAATRVGDLPELLGYGARGWLVEPDDAEALALALGDIAARPDEAARRAAAARAWFLDEASATATRGRVLPLARAALAGERR